MKPTVFAEWHKKQRAEGPVAVLLLLMKTTAYPAGPGPQG